MFPRDNLILVERQAQHKAGPAEGLTEEAER